MVRSHRTKPIEEWQKIDMRKDEDGNLELRNLQLFEAKSEREALNLLFLGNVNRMTAETPMNQVGIVTKLPLILYLAIIYDKIFTGFFALALCLHNPCGTKV